MRNLTRSWGLIEMRIPYVVAIAVALCIGSFLAGRYSGQPVPEPQPEWLAAQHDTMRALAEYFQSADPEKRKAVETATGLREIRASRIYQAFWISIQKGAPHHLVDDSQRVLYENPKLTLMVLKPLVRERPAEGDEGKTYPLSYAQEQYLGMCGYVGAIEKDGFARRILKEISETVGGEIAVKASKELKELAKDNYRTISASYRKTKLWSDLGWLMTVYLKHDMPVKEVVEVLGKPDFSEGAMLVYRAKREYPYLKDECYLWLYAYDSAFLDAWQLGGKPPEALEEMTKKLVPDY